MAGRIDIVKTFKVDAQQNDKISEIMEFLKKDQSTVIRLLIEVGYLGVKILGNNDKVGDWKIPGYEQLSPTARMAIIEILEREMPKKAAWIRARNELLLMKDATEHEKLLHQHPIHSTIWGSGDITMIPLEKAEHMIGCMEYNLKLLKIYTNFVAEHRRWPSDKEIMDIITSDDSPKELKVEPAT